MKLPFGRKFEVVRVKMEIKHNYNIKYKPIFYKITALIVTFIVNKHQLKKYNYNDCIMYYNDVIQKNRIDFILFPFNNVHLSIFVLNYTISKNN